ncbi:MAG: hypothetical protein NWE96_02415 [Candidatus Bathyarchaeota archaeon]|nr:hypothetical protein [Candidatus Bathyarchaeota archaeon]
MKKLIVIGVIAVIAVVLVIGALIATGILSSFFSSNVTPELKEASVAVSVGGGYNSETGLFDLQVNAQNMGQKDAKNVRVDVTFFNVDTQAEIKTETITIGDISAGDSKDISTSVQVSGGSPQVSCRTGTPVWD